MDSNKLDINLSKLRKDYLKAKELSEIEELIKYKNQFYEESNSLYYKYDPIQNRIFYLITKYVPNVKNSLIQDTLIELLVIKKSRSVLYNIIILNGYVLGLGYLLSSTINIKKGIFGICLPLIFSTLINSYLNFNFNYISMSIISPYLDIMYKDVSKEKTSGLELDNTHEDLKRNHFLYNKDIDKSIKIQDRKEIIDFYSYMLYSPADINIENEVYFLNFESGDESNKDNKDKNILDCCNRLIHNHKFKFKFKLILNKSFGIREKIRI